MKTRHGAENNGRGEMAQAILENKAFQESLVDGLNAAMLKAAEPLVKQALRDIEETMRGQLAAMLISTIRRDMVLAFYGHELRITLNQSKPQPNPPATPDPQAQ